jgi:hypothetical protein
MARLVLWFVLSVAIAWGSFGIADPSKPIKDAMNHRASVFDLYMHSLNADMEQEFKREVETAELGRFLAEIVERGGMVDESAKADEQFSKEFVARMKATPAFLFHSFDYDFASNKFTVSLGLMVPNEFPITESDLSFESEQKRKQFMEEATEKAWNRVSFRLTSHRIQKGYDSRAFDEEAFKKEVLDNTELKLTWHIYSLEPKRESTLAKLLSEKGVSGRSYTGTRAVGGRISVDYDDYIPKDKKAKAK